jgi:hypothetical protein
MKMQSSPKRALLVLLDMTFVPPNKLLFPLAVRLWSPLVSAGWFLITPTEELPQDPDLLGKIQSTSEQELSTKIIEDKSKLFFSIMELKTLKSSKNVCYFRKHDRIAQVIIEKIEPTEILEV